MRKTLENTEEKNKEKANKNHHSEVTTIDLFEQFLLPFCMMHINMWLFLKIIILYSE